MSITFGGQYIISLDWKRSGKGTETQDITRYGVDGHAYQEEAERGDEEPATITVDTHTPKTTYDTFKAMQGTLVSITDDFGDSFSNVMVRRVSLSSVQYVKTAIGGVTSGEYLLKISCMLTET